MNTKFFENLGFTSKEILVYNTLLELEETTSGPIIRKSRVSRSKVYDLLEKLKDKGLISQCKKGGVNYFKAHSPTRIVEFLEQKERELKAQKEEFEKDYLPQLLLKEQNKTVKQEVKMYVGYNGVKTFFREMKRELRDEDDYLGFAFNREKVNISIMKMFGDYHRERAKKGSKAKIICDSINQIPEGKKYYSIDKNYEFKYVESELPSECAIFNNTVAIFNWENTPKVFVIISEENALKYKDFFYSLWNQ